MTKHWKIIRVRVHTSIPESRTNLMRTLIETGAEPYAVLPDGLYEQHYLKVQVVQRANEPVDEEEQT